jgi:hypothetical protein
LSVQASIALDPHDEYDGNIDFKRRDADGIPIVTLEEIHSTSPAGRLPDPWKDPNSGDDDTWPPPALALELISMLGPRFAQMAEEAAETEEVISTVDENIDKGVLYEIPPAYAQGCSTSADSDSEPSTPVLVPDLSPTSPKTFMPHIPSLEDTFKKVGEFFLHFDRC